MRKERNRIGRVKKDWVKIENNEGKVGGPDALRHKGKVK